MSLRPYRVYRRYNQSKLKQSTYGKRQEHEYGPEWPKISAYVKRRDNYRCRIADLTGGRRKCQNRFPPPFQHLLAVHHIIRRQAGGSDHPRNLITICHDCHSWLHGRRVGYSATKKQKFAATRV